MDIKELCTPCYIINGEEYDKNLSCFRDAFEKQWGKNVLLGFSIKTNNFPYMLNRAMEKGFWAEVVSPDEMSFALRCGCSFDRIIYNGPQKGPILLEACKNGSIVNLDNMEEVENVCTLPSNVKKSVKVGIRVNFDLEKCCNGETTCEGIPGRFGICLENGDLHKAIIKLQENGIVLSGLHMHQSSKSRSLKIFEKISETAVDVGRQYRLRDLQYVDIGGGFWGGDYFPGKPTYNEYSETVCRILQQFYNPTKTMLVLEPGAAVLATAMDYLTSVLNIREVRGYRIITVDGSLLHVNPTMRNHPIPFTMINPGQEFDGEQIIGGSTCMELDRFLPSGLHHLVNHDSRFLFHCCGAYMSTHNSNFINAAPNIYLFQNGTYSLLRRKSIDALFRSE